MCNVITLKLIKETYEKIKKERDSQDIDISKLQTFADIKKAYLIKKIISDELKAVNPNVPEFVINRWANKEIKERIILKYRQTFLQSEYKGQSNYYARNTFLMILNTPWLCVDKEYNYFNGDNEIDEEISNNEKDKLNFILKKYKIGIYSYDFIDPQPPMSEETQRICNNLLNNQFLKDFEIKIRLRRIFYKIFDHLFGMNYLESRDYSDRLFYKLNRLKRVDD